MKITVSDKTNIIRCSYAKIINNQLPDMIRGNNLIKHFPVSKNTTRNSFRRVFIRYRIRIVIINNIQ